MPKLPGGPLATRPLHFVFIADCSGSMQGTKINELNHAIREAIPHMREVARGNPNAEVMVRSIRFADGASWHQSKPAHVETYTWTDLAAGGETAMGRALGLLAEAMKIPPMPDRALPPVLVLVSDGAPTDDFGTGLQALMAERWGQKAVRIAIAIGHDARLDILQQFIGNSETRPLVANNAQDLVKFVRWASTAVLKAASAPASQTQPLAAGNNVPLPPPPSPSAPADDVW